MGEPYSEVMEVDERLAEAIAVLAEAVRDQERFVGATLSGARRGQVPPAGKVTVRPVDLAEGSSIQFSTFDGTHTAVENLKPSAAVDRFEELVATGFGSVYVKTLDGDLQMSFSKKGRPRLVRHPAVATTIDRRHDRSKPRLVDASAPYLFEVGITDSEGRIKPTAQTKYRQVERFVEILGHALDQSSLATADKIRVADLGCGAGALTLAVFSELHHRRGIDVTMTGVDTKVDLMERLASSASLLGWDGLTFETNTIDGFRPDEPPELVIALHACDTATDDALARAVEWGAEVVLAAPCCQHHLQAQLDGNSGPPELAPLLRHGIVRDRLGDLLTDSLRSELLKASGYRTDVIEFVSTEHTAKNLMIRAIRTGSPDAESAAAADRLAAAWGVTPALRQLLATDNSRAGRDGGG